MENFIYPSDEEAKNLLVEVGKRMYAGGYVVTNDGNMSLKVSENEIWVTPTGVSKGYMSPDIMVKMNLSGDILEGKSRPSSEVLMHLRLYNENPMIKAAVHAHPPIATAFAIAGIPLDKPMMVESVVQLGAVPVAKYALPGSEEVPESIAPFCKDYAGVLLSNHGALTWGKDIMQAYYRMEIMENYAKSTIYVNMLGGGRLFSKEQMQEIANIKEIWGFKDGVLPLGETETTNLSDVYPREKESEA